MKESGKGIHKLAILGGSAAFSSGIRFGQLYFPSWDRYEAAMRGIFDRAYYTNHGPLAQEFESRLSAHLGVRHAIAVTNATVGLIIAAKALSLSGSVILPAFASLGTAQSVTWAGLEPAFCDVDPVTHHMRPELVEPLMDRRVAAIMGVNLWGGSCNPLELEKMAARYGVPLYFDSSHAFGCSINGAPIGGFGELEVFSFHATDVLSTLEGGAVCTNDDELAARVRNIRSSYGAGREVDVPITANGRFSEAQAAIGLMSLESYAEHRSRNLALFRQYERVLENVPGLHLVRPNGVEDSNYQYVVCRVDAMEFGLSRDVLIKILNAENVDARRYLSPGSHRSFPYDRELPQYVNALPNTDELARNIMQLPIGDYVSEDAIERIGEMLALVQQHSHDILRRMGEI